MVMLSHFSRSSFSRPLSQLVQRATTMPSSYKEAIETLNKLQSNIDYIRHAKVKNNQENNMMEMAKFLKRSGLTLDQLDTLPVIHIAGTNGKGTTCNYCENILRKHGYKTGFYSSPHLLEVRERIRLNGVPISQDKFSKYFWRVFTRLDSEKSSPYDMPLYFRFLTILAFHIFLAERIDVAILEVGIGGEFDCTNVVRKTVVAGITPLDIDHTTLLGNSMESIAWNKAGVMKPGAEVFTAPQPENAMVVLKERSIERQCTLDVVNDLYVDEANSRIPHQIQKTNASLALSVSRAFMNARPIITNNNTPKSVFDLQLAKQSIEAARWPGRYEIIRRGNTVFYLDGAHTVESMQVCSDWFRSKAVSINRRRVLMFNITGERNPDNLLKLLVNCDFSKAIFLPNVGDDNDSADQADFIQTISRQLERCTYNKLVWTELADQSEAEVLSSFSKAMASLKNREQKQFDVLVTGSLHLIGAALSVLDPTLRGSL